MLRLETQPTDSAAPFPWTCPLTMHNLFDIPISNNWALLVFGNLSYVTKQICVQVISYDVQSQVEKTILHWKSHCLLRFLVL